MPMIATTIINSMRVNPFCTAFIGRSSLRKPRHGRRGLRLNQHNSGLDYLHSVGAYLARMPPADTAAFTPRRVPGAQPPRGHPPAIRPASPGAGALVYGEGMQR